MSWTKEKIEILTQMWNEGEPASIISNVLDKSRNSVIGKAHRLKLTPRKSPILRRADPRPPLKMRHHMTVKKEIRLASTDEINNTIYGEGKTLADIKPNECRWPVGKIYCSAPVCDRVYCDKHYSIAFRKREIHG